MRELEDSIKKDSNIIMNGEKKKWYMSDFAPLFYFFWEKLLQLLER